MKNNDVERCPGCGKHCPMGKAGCGYGRKYFAKLESKSVARPAARPAPKPAAADDSRPKWEKHVKTGGLAWQLITTGRSMKEALKSGAVTEEKLFAHLSSGERAILKELLVKAAHRENGSPIA